jgi:hypothetical protein
MGDFKLNQITCGKVEIKSNGLWQTLISSIHHGKVEIISNDSMDLN